MSLEVVLITGMSGSGKSVALHALEDAGYYCVDNLPPELLSPFIALERQQQARRVAIAMDVRSGVSFPLIPQQLDALRQEGVQLRSLFLDPTTDALVRRFSETRRRHPLSRQEGEVDAPERHRALVQAIELERELLGFGAKITVFGPRILKKQILEQLTRAAGQYNSPEKPL